ncbi:MAG: hypothetical protein M1827_000638 [Pycnora praestabilis]|nr:MAG: hypothetical protein M1827_000638 [Pycnora praestabilis]
MDRLASSNTDQGSMLIDILSLLKAIQQENRQLSTAVEAIDGRVNMLAGVKQIHDVAKEDSVDKKISVHANGSPNIIPRPKLEDTKEFEVPDSPSLPAFEGSQESRRLFSIVHPARRPSTTSRIILTTYPGQSGIEPVIMNWGLKDPTQRGPVVVSRSQGTIRRRNAIGAHGGSYSIYHALAVASKNLDADHRPDFTNTEPAAQLGPFPQWADKVKIVSMDPLGHLAPWLFSDMIRNENIDIRPTIAITKAHMKLPELEQSVRFGRLVPDGKICLNESGELAVTKFAVEPASAVKPVSLIVHVGYVDEGALRRSLFENTGGSFPELITRGDIKLFLPPIGGLTVYCFGDPAKMSDPNVRLALRVHDECNGSDVFGSDICTCRPYLIFGVEEAVKEAQKGGSGVVIYFRKEGRALGEVTKYLVYNARKRGTDRASEYFQRTENIAGVKDMRFQALMPDVSFEVLLGNVPVQCRNPLILGLPLLDPSLVGNHENRPNVKHVKVSVSLPLTRTYDYLRPLWSWCMTIDVIHSMKHDAIVEQGIPILERVPIPDELIPEDSRVEIDAKIHAGYFTTGKVMNMTELSNVQGRAWDDVDVSTPKLHFHDLHASGD